MTIKVTTKIYLLIVRVKTTKGTMRAHELATAWMRWPKCIKS